MLCSSGLIFCGRAIDCRGFVPGTPKRLVRKAGPAIDNRETDVAAGLWTVDGNASGILDRIFIDGSWIGCITERRRSMSCRARGALTDNIRRRRRLGTNNEWRVAYYVTENITCP